MTGIEIETATEALVGGCGVVEPVADDNLPAFQIGLDDLFYQLGTGSIKHQ